MDHKVTSQVPVIPLAQVLLWCARIGTFSKVVAVGRNEHCIYGLKINFAS